MILKNAFRRKGRTTMTIIAVAISMALLVSMLSIAEGILYNAEKGIAESKRDIIISSEGAHGIVKGHDIVKSLKEDDNISEASAMLITDSNELLKLNFTDPNTGLYGEFAAVGAGIMPEQEKAFLSEEGERKISDIFEIRFNDWFNIENDPHYENNYSGYWSYEILIDETFANRHNISKGSELIINDLAHKFYVNGTFSTLISGEGLTGYFDFGIVIMHLSELQSLTNLNGSDVITSISISLAEEHKDIETARAIAREIKTKYPFYSVATKEDRLKSIQDQLVLAKLFYTAIGSVSMLIGILFVACIMVMSIYERTNEFGMMRAIGISKKTIFMQTLLESMVLVITGAAIGLLFGYFGSEALGDYLRASTGFNQDFTTFTPQLLIQSLLLVICFGTIISLYPAWQAARKKVVEALRFIR